MAEEAGTCSQKSQVALVGIELKSPKLSASYAIPYILHFLSFGNVVIRSALSALLVNLNLKNARCFAFLVTRVSRIFT